MKSELKKLLFCIILTGCMQACQDELYVNLGNARYSKEVMAAKAWYETNRQEESLFISRGINLSPLEAKPDWERTTVSFDEKQRVVEANLYMKGMLLFALPETKQEFDRTGDERYQYASSYTRLVIRTKLENGVTDGFLMSVVSSPEFLRLTNFKPFDKVGYIHRDKRFTGHVKYHNLEGEFVNGWVYKNGKITSSLRPLKK